MALSRSHLWSMKKWLQPFGCWYIPYTLPRSSWQIVSDFQLRSVSKTRWEALRYSKSYLLSDKYKFFVHTFTTDFQFYFLFPFIYLRISLLSLCVSSATTSWHYCQMVNPILMLKSTCQEARTIPRFFLTLLNYMSVLFSLDCSLAQWTHFSLIPLQNLMQFFTPFCWKTQFVFTRTTYI